MEVIKQEKKAILVVSFGTSYEETRKLTIEAIEDKVRSQYPDWEVRRAFTSGKIIKKLKERDNLHVDRVAEALQRLQDEGYTTVAVQSLHVIPGIEYEEVQAEVERFRDNNAFQKIELAYPLLYSMGQEGMSDDFTTLLKALQEQLPQSIEDNEAVVLMGHGSPHPTHAFYLVLQYKAEQRGMKNLFFYTVEGAPAIEDVVEELREKDIQQVTLMPFMLVAGDHAHNDMAGSEEDSAKSQLEAVGIDVQVYMRGLGENEAVQKIYLQRLEEAIRHLDSPCV
ncbi:sirohydrochlorin cobaltochelatase [Heliorestis acidaminivorans]|uniref:Sirohydrochlorin cobaltochelatase n=1 Tax=Heliorestis acidaminivorans TaxID=553427 RepID=A0A6I0EVB0_9FIRM|nr:sirohydrochlorin cobaltochelatase [Heliorestis acidaminivorans]KAB2953414.1 sirohydrochlorin cobaltochelatase [Heliorestis acidaminivorans]